MARIYNDSLPKCLICWFFAALILRGGHLCAQPAVDGLGELENKADAEFSRRDCAAASATYEQALAAARLAGDSTHVDFFWRRIGICRARVGDLTGALDAYRSGTAAGEVSGNRDMLAENVHGMALALQKLGRADEAMPLAQREYALTQQCGHPAHQVRAMWLVAELEMDRGRMRAGLAMMESALEISRATHDTASTAILLSNLATRYATLGDPDRALAMQKEILAGANPDNKPALAIAYCNLGAMQNGAGHRAEAEKSYARSLELAAGSDGWRVRIVALLNMSKLQADSSRFHEADASSGQALELAARMKVPALESAAYLARAELFEADPATRKSGQAGRSAEAALVLGREAGSPESIYQALFTRGKIRQTAGNANEAGADFDEALTLAEALREENSGEAADLQGAFASVLPLYRSSAVNSIALHRPEDGLRRAEQAKARVLTDILLRGGVDERASMDSGETAERNRLRARLTAANGAALGHPSPANTQIADTARQDLRQFLRSLYLKHPELALQSASFQPAGPEQFAALLADRQKGQSRALLDYFFVPSGVALFVVRAVPGQARPKVSAFLLSDPGNTLPGEIARFREQLANRDLDYRSAARHLYGRLLAPAMADLSSSTEWTISPDGALWELPFGALLDASGRHVVETRTVGITPSITALVRLEARGRGPSRGDIALLAFGNPLPSAGPLPDAAAEVQQIGAMFSHSGAVVLTGASATREQFMAQAPRARLIHLAAHGGLNNRDPLASFVRLAPGKTSAGDGVVTAADLADMHLSADLVVLSACETALGKTGSGEGMMGMGWALSVAGASSSVLSYWKIDSAASKQFMVAFYAGLGTRGTSSKASALRVAALRTMHSPGHGDPFYWAAFTLWGAGW
jgi:CHAT domain-containing protein/tetratricopeptide (TPR) repeat protein